MLEVVDINYIQHVKYNSILLLVIIFFCIVLEYGLDENVFVILGYLFSTVLLSPDFDANKSHIRKWYSMILLLPFLNEEHRGVLHSIDGVLLKACYLFCLLVLVLLALTSINIHTNDDSIIYIVYFIIGIILGDMVHIVFDRLNDIR